jgi:hypothetical protein
MKYIYIYGDTDLGKKIPLKLCILTVKMLIFLHTFAFEKKLTCARDFISK